MASCQALLGALESFRPALFARHFERLVTASRPMPCLRPTFHLWELEAVISFGGWSRREPILPGAARLLTLAGRPGRALRVKDFKEPCIGTIQESTHTHTHQFATLLNLTATTGACG
eukprot:4204166-Amphidinium_carterae.1